MENRGLTPSQPKIKQVNTSLPSRFRNRFSFCLLVYIVSKSLEIELTQSCESLN